MKLLSTEFQLTGSREHGGLRLSYKRYRDPCSNHSSPNTTGIALLFMHGIGLHKETWEPVIERIFQRQHEGGNRVNIVEAWAMDGQNHGYGARLNEVALLGRTNALTAHNVADGLRQLVQSGLITGKEIVAIGHSAGTTITVLSTCGYALDQLPYRAVLLIEPATRTRAAMDKLKSQPNDPVQLITALAKTRKDTWTSREAAYEWFSRRVPWKMWDSRSLKLFVDNALLDLPTATYPDHAEGVTLAATRREEVNGYRDNESGIEGLQRLSELCSQSNLPIHCIFGSRRDVVSEETRAGILDANEGRTVSSVTTIEGAGHFLPQELPNTTADTIWRILETELTKPESRL
ncbi:alpha/beta-hydrolase [Cristinia sonorae]|uniref:Alpha/beta-hydrolase n=1 Tax=Cristinia sonorae TaxID=1940300 RepID=A0A8K0USP1_9AGAR|nr:alpha/beta-hydrolase [Cristinia sonorae]